MNNQSRIDDIEAGIDKELVEEFAELTRGQERPRRNFGDALAREMAEQPRPENLLEEQPSLRGRVDHLQRTVARMRRTMMIANVLSAGVATCFILLVVFAYVVNVRPIPGLHIAGGRTIEADSVEVKMPSVAPSPSINPGFEITTTVDQKYQLIIQDLYGTALTIRRPEGSREARNAMEQDYIEFLVGVSRIGEQAAQDNASREIMLAIVNLARIGPDLRKRGRGEEISLDTRNRMKQIETVVRARDMR